MVETHDAAEICSHETLINQISTIALGEMKSKSTSTGHQAYREKYPFPVGLH